MEERRAYHPLAAFACAAALFVPAAVWSNPLWLATLLAAALAALGAVSGPAAPRRVLAVALPTAALFALVNVLFSRSGATVLVALPRLPLVGAPRLLLEPLVFGAASGLRIALAVTAFPLAEALADPDEAFAVCSRFAPKTALATALTLSAVPRLRSDLERIRGVMRIRGAALDTGGLLARLAAARPLLHALLSSSLEGAWDTAVALHTRGFGCGAPSAAPLPRWRPRDGALAAGAAASLAATLCGLPLGKGSYACYPRLSPLLPGADLAWLCAAVGAWLAGVVAAVRAPR